MIYNDIVSRIQTTLNTLNRDMYIPKRLILSIFKSKAEYLMAQRFNDKSLFREINLYKWVKCISMEETNSVKCGKMEIETCEHSMISKKKLPELIWSRYGASILMITNIINDKEYIIISPNEYITLKKRRGFEKFKGKYAIIYPDLKILIPDSTVTKINILLYSLDEKIDDISECNDDTTECMSYWEKEVNVPIKIREVVIQETLKELMIRLQIPKDELSDGDSNKKSGKLNGGQ